MNTFLIVITKRRCVHSSANLLIVIGFKKIFLGHIPKIIRSSASHPIKPKEILPRRVEKNKLHRYSKVINKDFE